MSIKIAVLEWYTTFLDSMSWELQNRNPNYAKQLGGSTNKLRFPKKGVSGNHPFSFRIFHEINQRAWGSPVLGTPQDEKVGHEAVAECTKEQTDWTENTSTSKSKHMYNAYLYLLMYILHIYIYMCIYIMISYNIMCPNQIRYAIYFHLTPSPKTPQGSHWRWQLRVDEAERDLHHGQWCDHHWHLVESMPMVVVCQMISEKWYTNNRWFGEESSHLSPPWLSVTPQWLVGKMMKMLA